MKSIIDEKDREVLYKHYKGIADKIRVDITHLSGELKEAELKAKQYSANGSTHPITKKTTVSKSIVPTGEIKWRVIIRQDLDRGELISSRTIYDDHEELFTSNHLTRDQAVSRIGSSLNIMWNNEELRRFENQGTIYYGKPDWFVNEKPKDKYMSKLREDGVKV